MAREKSLHERANMISSAKEEGIIATKTVPVFVESQIAYKDWKLTDKLCC